MFYILSRIFAWIAEPLAYIFICFILAIVLPRKMRRTRITMAILAVVLFFTFTNPMLYTCAERMWVANVETPDQNAIYDYGVVLGGYSMYDSERNTIEYQKAVDRLIVAVRYLREGRVKQIIISGDGSTEVDSATFYKEMKQVFDLTPAEVVMDNKPRNTRENATKTIELLGDSLAGKRLAVFTSAIHTPRSRLTFEQEGVDATYIPTDFRYRRDNYTMWMPSVEILADWGKLIHEWVGYVVYAVTK